VNRDPRPHVMCSRELLFFALRGRGKKGNPIMVSLLPHLTWLILLGSLVKSVRKAKLKPLTLTFLLNQNPGVSRRVQKATR
jgi:hypothetical protein